VHPEAVFGVPIDADTWSRNRQKLAGITDVEATMVIQDAALGRNGADRTLSDLEADGVLHIKIILENSRQGINDSAFDGLGHELVRSWRNRFRTIRFTDTKQRTCRLSEKAFPAIDLGRSGIFACCVQVGDRILPTGYSGQLPADVDAAAVELASVVESARAMRPNVLPCDAGTSFCPIGLAR
jgi:hypothetical protein